MRVTRLTRKMSLRLICWRGDNMFDKEYSFKGRHAVRVNELTMNFDGKGDGKGNKLFLRNYDVYLLAPIVGFLYQRRADIDTSTDVSPTKIFAEILMKNSDELKFNYRMIMLLDKNYEADIEKRIDTAFRGNESPEDIERYEQYVRGGVDLLYEKLMENVTNPDEYVLRLYDFLEEFDERYNQTINIDNVLEACRKIK